MNIKQQLEQVIGNFRDIASDLAFIGRTAFSNAVSRETANLSAIVEQMNADEQAIVEEVNKRWPTGKPQPDDTFVGAAPQVPDGMVQYLLRVLSATAFENCDDIWWRVDGEYSPLTIFVNCNDLFYWGCADSETVTPNNIDIFEQAYMDSPQHGGLLFCCRVRGMRPQGAYYKYLKADEKQLFDACGPERETGIGNPHAQSEYD